MSEEQETGTLEQQPTGAICPEGWVWDHENAECKCGAPQCPEGYAWDQPSKRCKALPSPRGGTPGCWPGQVWDPVQQKCVPVVQTPTGFQMQTNQVLPRSGLCPPGTVWVQAAGRCVPLQFAPSSRVGEVPEVPAQASVIKPDGTVAEEPVEFDALGQENGDGNGDPAPSPDGSGTRFRFRFPFPAFWTYPIIARYPYAPPYPPIVPRPRFPVRVTLFSRAVSNYYQPYGWIPIGIIEVDSIATALQIARCMGGAIGPVGAVTPAQFP